MQTTVNTDLAEDWVDNPLTTYAQTLHEAQTGMPRAGKERVTKNLRTLMGGFHKFGLHGRLPPDHLCEAASRLKSVWEAAQIGGARAVDPSREPVDGGPGSFGMLDGGLDAQRELNIVTKLLGPADFRRVEYIVIREHGPMAYARWRASIEGGAINGRVMAVRQREVWTILDRLAVYWRLRRA